jgi:murein DD-endopeptidase MepM/ murein hydrolase activator NlpD
VRTRRSLLCLAAALVLAAAAGWTVGVLAAPPARALTLSQLEALIQQARTRKQGLNSTIARLDARLDVISDRLNSLNERIAVVAASLTEQQAEYDRLHAELVAKQRQLMLAEQKLRWQQLVFTERVVQTYKAGEVDYLAVLLKSSSYEDMLTRVSFLRSLVQSDNSLVGQLTSARDAVALARQQIASDTQAARELRDEVKRRNDELVALRAEQVATAASTSAIRREKARALAAVEHDIRAWEAQEAELATESQGLAGLIQAQQGGGALSGSLAWPVRGPVTSPFGWRIHPIFHVRKFHTGIDIGVGYGTPIHAAAAGRVIYASWMSGYGNTIIIDHGGGISTLYAHQSSLAVGLGAGVSGGQVIGYVGSTGYSTGPHLHFEVRVNGNPVNPLGYLH